MDYGDKNLGWNQNQASPCRRISWQNNLKLAIINQVLKTPEDITGVILRSLQIMVHLKIQINMEHKINNTRCNYYTT